MNSDLLIDIKNIVRNLLLDVESMGLGRNIKAALDKGTGK
jgi:hypothetical protein